MSKYLEMLRRQERECQHLAPVWGPEHETDSADWQRMAEVWEAMVAAVKYGHELMPLLLRKTRYHVDETHEVSVLGDKLRDALALAEPKEE